MIQKISEEEVQRFIEQSKPRPATVWPWDFVARLVYASTVNRIWNEWGLGK